MKQAMIIVNPSSGKEEVVEHVRNVEDIYVTKDTMLRSRRPQRR